jgi:hypothetical protein
MKLDLSSAEFLGLDAQGRAKKCREMAAEAEASAVQASSPGMKTDYVDLARQWRMLADEIEHAANVDR